ncbi:histidine phosphatase family protein [Staphylococcus caeli]|uniref:Phosphoglycerate mutase n=1 Tax=Staphylococcus caeli TaxID=2201815 RepID=A0A1D4MPY4_9STAP|nr:histidine phosphatase family protein [Staphylococcus caeli]SCT00502.1 phosphoglycerate mutase [Staphylococcus caeli]SCT22383.1 phosphoglycerate mutase [Staphylococcus caeli]
MTEICFIRHGETDWNTLGKLQGRTNIALNDNGIQQAEACAHFLKNSKWDLIITSPLARAHKTAEIIQQNLDIPLIKMDTFIEIGFGAAEGLTIEERISLYPDKVYPNGETDDAVTQRFLDGLLDVTQQYTNQRILIVSHGAFIKAIFRHYSNGTMGNNASKIANGSFSTLKFENNHFTILNYNETPHLPL